MSTPIIPAKPERDIPSPVGTMLIASLAIVFVILTAFFNTRPPAPAPEPAPWVNPFQVSDTCAVDAPPAPCLEVTK